MLRSRYWAIWLLMLVPLAGEAAAQRQTEPPLAFRRVLIPAEQAETLLQREKETLHPVPPQQFERLLAIVQNAPVLDRESVRTRITRCEHTLDYLPPQTLQGTTRLWIDHRAEHPVLLPLVPWKVALQEARWVQPEKSAAPGVLGMGPGGRVLLLVERSGQVEIRWQLRATQHTPRGGRFELALPPVPGAVFSVQAPENTHLRVSPPSLLQEVPATPAAADTRAALTRWQVRPPAVSSLVFQFQKHQATLAIAPGYRQHNQVQLAPQGLQMVSTVVFQGAVPKEPLRFQTPQGLEILRVETAEKTVPFRRIDTETIELIEPGPLRPGESLRIHAAAAWSLDQRRRLPKIRPQGAVWQSEQTQLQLLSPLVLKYWHLAHCRQTAPWNGQTTTVQHFDPGGTIELEVGQAEPKHRMSQATAVEIAPGTLVAHAVFQVEPQGGELFHLEAMLEPGWTLDRVETEPAELLRHWHLEPAPQGRRRLHLELGQALPAGQKGLFRLELHQRMINRRRSLPLDWLWPVSFPEAPYPAQRWLCLHGETAAPPQIRSPMLRRPLKGKEKEEARLLLPQLPLEAVIWQLPPGRLSGEVLLAQGKPEFQITVQQQLQLHEQRWVLDTELQIDPQAGEIDHLELIISPWADPPQVVWPQGESPPRLEERPLEGAAAMASARRFRLVFPRPIRTATSVQLRWQGRWTAEKPLHVPLVGIAQGEAAQGNVSVLAQKWLPLVWKTSSLIASSGDEASSARMPWQRLAGWSYDPQRLAEQPELFLLTLSRENNPALQRPVVWQLRVDTYWDAHSQVLEHRCRLLLDHPPSGRLEFSIPPGLEVTALSLDGRPRQWHLERHRLHIQVPQAAAPRQVLLLECWLRTQWHPQGFWGRVAPPQLKTDYPILSGRWYLWSGRQLVLPGPASASLWQRWFGPLASDTPPSAEAWAGEEPQSPLAVQRLQQVQHALAAQLQPDTSPPADWGTLLLQAAQTLRQQGVVLLLDSAALARAGITPRTPLPAGPFTTETTPSLAELQQRLGLKLVPLQEHVLLTTQAEMAQSLPATRSSGSLQEFATSLPAHWISPAQWLWWHQNAGSGDTTSALIFGREPNALWQPVAALEFSPEKELPHLVLAWSPWWEISGWATALLVALAVLSTARRYPRSTAAAVVLGFWVAAVAPLPWLLLTQRAVWGLWAGVAALAFASSRKPEPGPEPPTHRSRVAEVAGASVFLGLLALGGWHSFAQAPGGKVYSVFIPEEEKPEYYFVPEEFYRFLVEQADRLSRKPRGWLLQRASYRVTLPEEEDPQAQVLAFYYVRVFGTQEPIELDFSHLPADLRPESVGINGMSSPARWNQQGNLLVQVPEPGTYELELSFRVPVEEDDSASHIRLPVPPSISARLEVLAGDEPVTLHVAPCWGSVQDQARGELWRGELGPVAQLGLRWQPFRQERPARLEADQLLWLKVHPGSVVLETQLHCRPLDAPLEHVEVWVAPALQLIPPESPLVEQFQWVSATSDPSFADAPAPGMKLLRLKFQEPIAGPVELPLAFVLKDASGVGRWRFPLVQLRHTESLQYWIAVSVGRTLQFHEQGQDGLEPLETEAFAALWNQVEESPAVSYDCGSRYPVQYTLVTSPKSEPPRVESSQTWKLFPGYAELEFEARVNQRPGTALYYRIHVPPQVRVLEVQARDQQRWKPLVWGRWQQEVVFWLPEALAPLHVRLRGWMPLAAAGNWQVPPVELIGASSAQQRVRIYHHGTLLVLPQGEEQPETPPPAADPLLLPCGQWDLSADRPRPAVRFRRNQPQVVGQLDCTVVPARASQPWRINYQLNLNVQQGVLPWVKFSIRHVDPQSVRLVGPGRLEFWAAPGQEELLVYYPPRPLRARAQVPLEILWQPRPDRDTPLPQLLPLELQDLQTYLLIPEPAADAPWQWRFRRLTPLPLQGRPLAPVPRPRALRATRPQWQLVMQPRQTARHSLRLLLARHRLDVAECGQVIQRSVLLLATPGEAGCRFQLPEGARVIAVRLGNQPALWHQETEHTVLVRIPASSLPRVLQLVAELPSLEPPRSRQAATTRPAIVRLRDISSGQQFWTISLPWSWQGSLLRSPPLPPAQEYANWFQVLAAQVAQAPATDAETVQRWWNQIVQALQLFPLPPQLQEPQAVDPAWHDAWLAQQTLQQVLQARRITWPLPEPLPRSEGARAELHAQGPQPPQLVLRPPASSPLAGAAWWMWLLAPLGAVLAVWGTPVLAALWQRWPGWLLVLAGLVWLVGLNPSGAGLALIAAGVLVTWQNPP